MTLLQSAFLISHSINAIIALILVLVTLRIYLYSKIHIVLLISILMTSWMITNTLLIIPILYNEITENQINLIATWNVIGSAIVPAVFILFIDSFEGKVETTKTALSAATISAAVVIALAGLINSIDLSSTIIVVDDLITMRWSPLTSLALFPAVIICGIWTQQELNASLRHTYNSKQIKQIQFMKIGGGLMFFIGPIFGILGVILVDGLNEPIVGTWMSEIIGYLIVSVGIFMITLSYTSSKAVAFLQPQQVDTLIIIYATGIPIHQFDFNREQKMETDLPLISGAISAITAIMGEAFNVSSMIRQIQFQDKELMLNFQDFDNSGESIALILVTERNSNFLKTSLNRFANIFRQTYEITLINGMGLNDDQLADTDILIEKSFGLS